MIFKLYTTVVIIFTSICVAHWINIDIEIRKNKKLGKMTGISNVCIQCDRPIYYFI